ncbi:MAG: glycosyltransferase family 2 protein [Flexilinea sp.]|nr:glycosyltransferase family 2 protein [Flexilinea sp.]
MLFSIIVPVYNVEKYIRECLDSILNQQFRDFELILVDDGSTDSSGKICDEYAENFPCVTVLHKENEGLLLARRTGLKAAKGDYVMHCDSDDYYAPTTLAEVRKVIQEKYPDMVMFGYNVVDDDHRVFEEHYDVFPDHTFFEKTDKEKLLVKLSTTTWLNNMVTKATRRECIDIEEDYSEYRSIKMGEDLFQVIPLVRNCTTFVYISKPLYFYRSNPKGMSKNITRSYLDNHFLVSDRLYKLLKDNKVTDNTMMGFYNRYVKDLYKYLLRFLKQGLDKTKFLNTYQLIENDPIFIDAKKNKEKWNIENRLLYYLIKPENYTCVKILAKKILYKKL